MKTDRRNSREFSRRKLKRKFIRHLHGSGERDRFLGFYRTGKTENRFVLRGDLSNDERKERKKLLKTIKKNRKKYKIKQLVIVGALITALFFTIILLKNRVADYLIERGLEEIFHAKVDLYGVNVGIGSLSWGRLAVTNKHAPMTNLFELGRTRFAVKVRPLFVKSVVIEDISVEGIDWNTPRERSGALPRFAHLIGREREFRRDHREDRGYEHAVYPLLRSRSHGDI